MSYSSPLLHRCRPRCPERFLAGLPEQGSSSPAKMGLSAEVLRLRKHRLASIVLREEA